MLREKNDDRKKNVDLKNLLTKKRFYLTSIEPKKFSQKFFRLKRNFDQKFVDQIFCVT